jgi:hypothetical protein
VLHLFARCEVILPRCLLGFGPDLVPTTERRQRRVAGFDAHVRKLLGDTHEIAATFIVQRAHQVERVGESLLALETGHLDLAAADDVAHRVTRQAQSRCDFPRSVPLLRELQNRGACVQVEHRAPLLQSSTR